MKVLLLNGSPHEKGCTYTALCEVAGALEKNGIETEIFQIGNKPVSGCIGWTVPFTAEAPLLPISREQRLPAAAAQEQQQRSIS